MITVAETQQGAIAAESARKAIEAQEGPGRGVQPGHLAPESVGRTYIEQGHAAESPQAEGPRSNPMPLMQHRVLPDQPMAAAIPPHVIAAFTSGSPSDR